MTRKRTESPVETERTENLAETEKTEEERTVEAAVAAADAARTEKTGETGETIVTERLRKTEGEGKLKHTHFNNFLIPFYSFACLHVFLVALPAVVDVTKRIALAAEITVGDHLLPYNRLQKNRPEPLVDFSILIAPPNQFYPYTRCLRYPSERTSLL